MATLDGRLVRYEYRAYSGNSPKWFEAVARVRGVTFVIGSGFMLLLEDDGGRLIAKESTICSVIDEKEATRIRRNNERRQRKKRPCLSG